MILGWPLLALVCVGLVASAPAPAPAPQSSVRVRFVSRPTSYSHSVDISPPVRGRSRFYSGRRASLQPSEMTVAVAVPLDNEPHPGYQLRRPTTRIPRTFTLQRSSQESLSNSLADPEAMWPMGVFQPPDHDLRALHLSLDAIENQQLFSDAESDPDDPYLRTGEDGLEAVRLQFSRGELFYDEFPHGAALLRLQEERLANGLAGNRLGSNRPESPYYRWPAKRARARNPPAF